MEEGREQERNDVERLCVWECGYACVDTGEGKG